MDRKKTFIIIAVVVAIVLFTAVYYLLNPSDDAITATGMVEITQADLTPKVGGYLLKRNFKEGTQVQKGQVIAQIDPKDYQLTYMQAVAAYQSALSKLADLESGSRSEEIAGAQAAYNAANDALSKATTDYNRFYELEKQGAISVQQLDNYRVAMSNAQGTHRQALAAYNLALEGNRKDTITAQKHLVEQMDYAMQSAKTNLEYTDVKAPVDGRILSKNYEIGEYVQPGAPIATIGDMSDCWVKIYVPSTLLGKITLDQKAEVKIDSIPDKVFQGTISEIATKAEYTPRQTITRDERANLVFAVKIALINDQGIFKPGMPAEVRIP